MPPIRSTTPHNAVAFSPYSHSDVPIPAKRRKRTCCRCRHKKIRCENHTEASCLACKEVGATCLYTEAFPVRRTPRQSTAMDNTNTAAHPSLGKDAGGTKRQVLVMLFDTESDSVTDLLRAVLKHLKDDEPDGSASSFRGFTVAGAGDAVFKDLDTLATAPASPAPMGLHFPGVTRTDASMCQLQGITSVDIGAAVSKEEDTEAVAPDPIGIGGLDGASADGRNAVSEMRTAAAMTTASAPANIELLSISADDVSMYPLPDFLSTNGGDAISTKMDTVAIGGSPIDLMGADFPSVTGADGGHGVPKRFDSMGTGTGATATMCTDFLDLTNTLPPCTTDVATTADTACMGSFTGLQFPQPVSATCTYGLNAPITAAEACLADVNAFASIDWNEGLFADNDAFSAFGASGSPSLPCGWLNCELFAPTWDFS